MHLAKENPGASNKAIEKLPKKKFVEGMYEEEDSQCVICLNDYVNDDDLRVAPCNHHFHAACIDRWLKINKKCPLCMQCIDGSQDEENVDAADSTPSEDDSSSLRERYGYNGEGSQNVNAPGEEIREPELSATGYRRDLHDVEVLSEQ